MISFNTIPAGGAIRTPFVAVEFDSSGAQKQGGLKNFRALLLSQKVTAGTGVVNTLYRVTSADGARTLAGSGSLAHRQAQAWFTNNRFTEFWLMLVDDNGAGVSGVGTTVVTGPATAAGTIVLYEGGKRVTVAVANGDSANTIAASINTAINAADALGVTSTVSTNTVTRTARHKGTEVLPASHSYQPDEALPAGVGLTINQLSGGATNPVLTSAIAALGDEAFDVIAHPWTDATSLTAIETELLSRWQWDRQINGLAFTGVTGSFSTLTTLGDTRNSPYSHLVGQPGENPVTAPSEFGAAFAAQVCYYGALDPARPFQTLALAGTLPPRAVDKFTFSERNMLLFSGICATEVAAGGVVQISSSITTYKTNAAGADDTAYLYTTTLLTLSQLQYSFATRIKSKYPRHKLSSAGARAIPGQPIMDPVLGKAEALAWFDDMESIGLVENSSQFKDELVVEVDGPNNRLNFYLPPDLMNQLVVTAAKIAFKL